jgi:multidrug efflux pump subunit AcrA (membrane-fusion protein)
MMFRNAPGGLRHLLTLVTFGAYMLGTPPAWGAEALPFEVAMAQRHEVVVKQVFDGKIEAIHRSTVSSQINGRVIEVNYDVDDYVAL